MSEQNAVVTDFRLVVYGKAEKRTITIKNGENAGKTKDLLQFRAFHSEPVDKESKQFTSTWYDVNCFQDNSFYLVDHICDGLVLYVTGQVKTSQYTAKDGSLRENQTINAKKIYLDLLQRGLKSITFERPTRVKE